MIERCIQEKRCPEMFFVHQYRLSYGKSVGVLCFLRPIFFVGDGDESAWMTSRARRDTAIAQTTQLTKEASGMATRLSSPWTHCGACSILRVLDHHSICSGSCHTSNRLCIQSFQNHAAPGQINLPILAHKVREHSLTSAFEEKSLLQPE